MRQNANGDQFLHLGLVFGVGIAYATVRFRYRRIANILKWLALTLFSYVITAFTVHRIGKDILRGHGSSLVAEEPRCVGAAGGDSRDHH